MSSWLIPANPKIFRIDDCISRFGNTYWRQHTNVARGDTVYMYICKPVQAVVYKMTVIDSDIPHSAHLNRDRDYWIKSSGKECNRYLLLQPTARISSDVLTLDALLHHGLNGVPQGAMRVNGELLDFIESYI